MRQSSSIIYMWTPLLVQMLLLSIVSVVLLSYRSTSSASSFVCVEAAAFTSPGMRLLSSRHRNPSHLQYSDLPATIAPEAVGKSKAGVALQISSASSSASDISFSPPPPSVVIVSPPGGIGEVAAVKAALFGASVRWFVVSSSSSSSLESTGTPTTPTTTSTTTTVRLSSHTLEAITSAGGSLQLAGATASNLLLNGDKKDASSSSALAALAVWCGGGDGKTQVSTGRNNTNNTYNTRPSPAPAALICTFDGMEEALIQASGNSNKKKPRRRQPSSSSSRRGQDGATENDDPVIIEWKNAIKVAAREASQALQKPRCQIAILAAAEEDDARFIGREKEGGDSKKDFGVVNLVSDLLKGTKPLSIPVTLTSALSSSAAVADQSFLHTLRHGELFGIPESSPDFSPLVGGPRRIPELTEEFSMRRVRIDPTRSLSGNYMMGSSTRSSRQAVGEAAALLAVKKVSYENNSHNAGLDVCVSSLRGYEPFTLEMWDQEFQRVQSLMSSSSSSSSMTGGAPLLFSAEFASVPDVKRLADWLAIKWAPAILRTYEIAAIRVGARPVSASRVGDNQVQVMWQDLVNFETVMVGTMLLTITDRGLVATRGPGDARRGFGDIPRRPLAGEDVLVRQLAEAVAQAMDKGLANKPMATTKLFSKDPIANDLIRSVYKAEAEEDDESMLPKVTVSVATATIEPPTVIQDTSSSNSSNNGGDSELKPRQPGVRRSKEKKRGSQRRQKE